MDNLLEYIIGFQIVWACLVVVVALPLGWLFYRGLNALKEDLNESSTTPSSEKEE